MNFYYYSYHCQAQSAAFCYSYIWILILRVVPCFVTVTVLNIWVSFELWELSFNAARQTHTQLDLGVSYYIDQVLRFMHLALFCVIALHFVPLLVLILLYCGPKNGTFLYYCNNFLLLTNFNNVWLTHTRVNLQHEDIHDDIIHSINWVTDWLIIDLFCILCSHLAFPCDCSAFYFTTSTTTTTTNRCNKRW